MKEKFKYFFLLTFSTLLIAFGTYFFKFTNNFTFGGITGLAVLVAKTGLISASDFNLVMSMILLLIGLIILGKKFAARTAYCSILLSVALSAMERIWNYVLLLRFLLLDPRSCSISELPAAVRIS